jgi:sec-independent protein translocase protein TatA
VLLIHHLKIIPEGDIGIPRALLIQRRISGGVMFEGLLQPTHLLVILFIALLVFGPSKLADLGKGLGDGIRQFKEGVRDQPKPAPQTASGDEPVSGAQ